MNAANEPSLELLTFVGTKANREELGDDRPVLRALRMKELARVRCVHLLCDLDGGVSLDHAEALAKHGARARQGPQFKVVKLHLGGDAGAGDLARLTAALDARFGALSDQTAWVVSTLSGSFAMVAALCDLVDRAGAPLRVIYARDDDDLSIWRAPAEATAAAPTLARFHDAPALGTVLLQGATGAGKSHAARMLHEAWREKAGRGGRLLTVNAAGLGRELLGSELFGHVQGAFTSAVKDRKGAFREADGGTLFLDEIGELPVDLQGHLLTALDLDTKTRKRSVRALGSDVAHSVDVRLVAGTNRDLLALAREGRFRLDLLGRLNTHQVELPTLAVARHRALITAQEALAEQEARYGCDLRLEGSARQALVAFALSPETAWPWNHRDVLQMIERLCLRAWQRRPLKRPVAKGEARPVVHVSVDDVNAECEELRRRWSQLAAPAERADDDEVWAVTRARVRAEAWDALSHVERWELHHLLTAERMTATHAAAWAWLAARNLVEGARTKVTNPSNAFGKRLKRYEAALK